MAEQSITLQPGESKTINFEFTPTEARTYQVALDGLSGSFISSTVVAMGLALANKKYGATTHWSVSVSNLDTHESYSPTAIPIGETFRFDMQPGRMMITVYERNSSLKLAGLPIGPLLVDIPSVDLYTINDINATVQGLSTIDMPAVPNESIVTGIIGNFSDYPTYNASIGVESIQEVDGKANWVPLFNGLTVEGGMIPDPLYLPAFAPLALQAGDIVTVSVSLTRQSEPYRFCWVANDTIKKARTYPDDAYVFDKSVTAEYVETVPVPPTSVDYYIFHIAAANHFDPAMPFKLVAYVRDVFGWKSGGAAVGPVSDFQTERGDLCRAWAHPNPSKIFPTHSSGLTYMGMAAEIDNWVKLVG